MNIIIENFPNYRIDSTGNIWSIRTKRCKLMNPYTFKFGYKMVCLHRDGKFFNFLVHRLVAKSFIPNPENKPFVCHKNDNPSDNRVNNLFWGTQKDNMDDMISKGRKVIVKGVDAPTAKLTDERIIFIRGYPTYWGAQKELATMFNVSASTISEILAGNKWKHLL